MTFLEEFDRLYAQKLGNRYKTFRKIFELLEAKNKNLYLIVETGCSRIKDNYAGDGMSTVLFDKFINFYNGKLISVDINEKHCQLARSLVSEKTEIFCDDSVKFLWGLNPESEIDLLYLDSYDINFNDPHLSMLHHLKEFCAIIGKLKKSTIVVVDDNIENAGKGKYIEDFMTNLGYKKIINDYQIGWIL